MTLTPRRFVARHVLVVDDMRPYILQLLCAISQRTRKTRYLYCETSLTCLSAAIGATFRVSEGEVVVSYC